MDRPELNRNSRLVQQTHLNNPALASLRALRGRIHHGEYEPSCKDPIDFDVSRAIPSPISVRLFGQRVPKPNLLDRATVPKIAEFDGIRIMIYGREHGRPHFHARFAEHTIVVSCDTNLEILAGQMPRAQTKRIMKWASSNQQLLLNTWNSLNREDR